jgi:pimeloyl-ACP methyl ester carboxylesterase
LPRSRSAKRQSSILGVAALALAGSAILVNRRAAQAERKHPPKGSFVATDGVRLHYLERGHGQPVVFLHGNGAMIEDMLISGVLDHAAPKYRAIAFDRPGFGHSERPRGRSWTAAAQAALFAKALAQLGVERPIVVGHSWGTLVALALALDHPQSVAGLVLASGYYFPTARRRGSVLAAFHSTPRRCHQLYRRAPDRRGYGAAPDQKNVRAATGLGAI